MLDVLFAVLGVAVLAFWALDRGSAAYIDRRERRLRPARLAAARSKFSGTRLAPVRRRPGGDWSTNEIPTRTLDPYLSEDGLQMLTVYPDSTFDRDLLVLCGGRSRTSRWWALEFWGEYWIFTARTESEWATLLSQLRDIGVAFSAGRVDSSTGVEFERLRTQGLVSGSYYGLVFDSHGWRVVER